jgi:hypothetical protein
VAGVAREGEEGHQRLVGGDVDAPNRSGFSEPPTGRVPDAAGPTRYGDVRAGEAAPHSSFHPLVLSGTDRTSVPPRALFSATLVTVFRIANDASRVVTATLHCGFTTAGVSPSG